MGLNPNGDLVKVSLILTRDQDRRMRALHSLRKTPHNRLTLADVGREVVEAGLDSILSVPHSNSSASAKIADRELALAS